MKTCMLFTSYNEFYDFMNFSSVTCVISFLCVSVGLCEVFLSFGIIRSINSHTARDKGLTNVGVWVSVGLNGDTCCLSHSFFVQTLLLPSFPVSFNLFCCLTMVISYNYCFCLYCFPFLDFPVFLFFHWLSVPSFALANKMFALHFFFSLVSFDLNWFLSFKKTIFLFKQ